MVERFDSAGVVQAVRLSLEAARGLAVLLRTAEQRGVILLKVYSVRPYEDFRNVYLHIDSLYLTNKCATSEKIQTVSIHYPSALALRVVVYVFMFMSLEIMGLFL